MANSAFRDKQVCLFESPQGELLLGFVKPFVATRGFENNAKISFFEFSLDRCLEFSVEIVAKGEKAILKVLEEFAESLEEAKSDKNKSWNFDWREPSREFFEEDFSFVKKAIEKGQTQKAVPICFSESIEEPEPSFRLDILRKIIENRSFGFPLAVVTDSLEYYSLSPELLFSREGDLVKTMALAGTRPLGEDFQESEFLQDPKERAEHEFVVESLCTELGRLGAVQSSSTYVIQLKSLAHLKTDIELMLQSEISNLELIQKLHPTPALGDYPRGSMKEWLSKLDMKTKRGFFGAPILIEYQNQAKCIVGIRSLLKQDSVWRIGSGCGVVAESQLDKEWSELGAKRESVKRSLGIL